MLIGIVYSRHDARTRSGRPEACPGPGVASQHDAQAEHDEARTNQLNAYGYWVIRFRNEEVLEDLPAVLERILEVAEDSLP